MTDHDLQGVIRAVQVNIPFRMLVEDYLPAFVEAGLNPEIGIDAEVMDRYTRAEFVEIAALFRRHRRTVTLHGPFLDLSPGSPDRAIHDVTRSRLSALIDLIAVFKPLTVVCHAGYDARRYGFLQEEWFERALAFWRWAGSEIQKSGSRLMLENVYEEGPEEMRPLFAALPDIGVGFCLDPGHQAAFSRTPLESWLASLGRYIGQVHLHDNHGDRDAHLALGAGAIPFETLFNYLNAIHDRQVIITLEPHDETALWPSLEYLRRYFYRV